LASAINSLQNKTVTITTIRREVVQQVCVQHGGIINAPTLTAPTIIMVDKNEEMP
jgi:hypothetical protein